MGRAVALEQEAASLDHHDGVGFLKVAEAALHQARKMAGVYAFRKVAEAPVSGRPGNAGGLGRQGRKDHPRHASRARTSSTSAGVRIHSAHRALASTCSGVVAPAITELTTP